MGNRTYTDVVDGRNNTVYASESVVILSLKVVSIVFTIPFYTLAISVIHTGKAFCSALIVCSLIILQDIDRVSTYVRSVFRYITAIARDFQMGLGVFVTAVYTIIASGIHSTAHLYEGKAAIAYIERKWLRTEKYHDIRFQPSFSNAVCFLALCFQPLEENKETGNRIGSPILVE